MLGGAISVIFGSQVITDFGSSHNGLASVIG